MKLFNSDEMTDRVLNSFFLLEPEWQIPAFIFGIAIVLGLFVGIRELIRMIIDIVQAKRRNYEEFIAWKKEFRKSPDYKKYGRSRRQAFGRRDAA